jgi:hypothetical protein
LLQAISFTKSHAGPLGCRLWPPLLRVRAAGHHRRRHAETARLQRQLWARSPNTAHLQPRTWECHSLRDSDGTDGTHWRLGHFRLGLRVRIRALERLYTRRRSTVLGGLSQRLRRPTVNVKSLVDPRVRQVGPELPEAQPDVRPLPLSRREHLRPQRPSDQPQQSRPSFLDIRCRLG